LRRGICRRSLRRLARLRIAVDAETDRHAWSATREHDLTVNDAAYLELAIRRREALASGDGALVRAARKVGLEVLGD
jgi:predicted nucleic acid-binding protein